MTHYFLAEFIWDSAITRYFLAELTSDSAITRYFLAELTWDSAITHYFLAELMEFGHNSTFLSKLILDLDTIRLSCPN